MRRFAALLLLLVGFCFTARAQTAPACTGLCLQQVSCPAGTTTSISGVVYAPNGVDPLPNVLVYIPNAPVDAFVPGVSCPVVGQPPSGSPLAGATTAVDGSFSIPNAPVGTNIPLVILSGRWRRQFTVSTVKQCIDNPLPSAPAAAGVMPFVAFPQNQSQGDIPKIAVATGFADSVECVLRKVGIDDSEFTDPSAAGRINFYLGSAHAGSAIDTATPSESDLMSNSATLNSYDVLMLPCEGTPAPRSNAELPNLVKFANAGGRVYASHYSYEWLYRNPPFDTVANWIGGSATLPNGIATINTGFSGGNTLSQWLTLVGATTAPGQIAISTLRHDLNGVNAPTENWMTLNNLAAGNPVMQLVFDTPVGATTNQCGRVLFNEYHVETGTGTGKFPTECTAGKMTPQEKLLEYSLFELTNDGGAAILKPTAQDFGTQPIGFNSPVQSFTWTNNSTFNASVTLLTGSGDFSIVGQNCGSVPPYGSCQINMVFNPTAIGPRTGLLTVGSSGTTLTAALTGIGIPDLTISSSSLTFGNLDVGASASQTIAVNNAASGAVPVPALVTTGDFAATSNCGASLAPGAACAITVTFTPTATGARPGTLAAQSATPGPPTTLTGNGIDFTIAASPSSGTVIAGLGTSTQITTAPLAGFTSNLGLTCTTNAPGSVCTLSSAVVPATGAVITNVAITTTAQYTVVGYGGLGGNRWLTLLGIASGLLLWTRRRNLPSLARTTLSLCLLAAALGSGALGLTGCTGHLPAKNPNYTPATGSAGPYTYTITATDGFLVHSATYALTVTAK
jgi:hypothetical protein